MELKDLVNIDPLDAEHFVFESNELLNELKEDLINAQRAYAEQEHLILGYEGQLHKEMLSEPAKFGLKKTTNNDITYAMQRNKKLMTAKLKLADLKKEENCAWKNIELFHGKKEILMSIWKGNQIGMSLENQTRGNSFAERKRQREES